MDLTRRDRIIARAVERFTADHIFRALKNVLGRLPSIREVEDAARRGLDDAGIDDSSGLLTVMDAAAIEDNERRRFLHVLLGVADPQWNVDDEDFPCWNVLGCGNGLHEPACQAARDYVAGGSK